MLPFSSPFSLDLIEYGRALGEARRHDPRDDITTRLVEAELDGSRLSEQEFGTMFILLTTAGNETTRHTISLGLVDLLAQPRRARSGSSPTRRSRQRPPTSSSVARMRSTISAAPRRRTSCSTAGGSSGGTR